MPVVHGASVSSGGSAGGGNTTGPSPLNVSLNVAASPQSRRLPAANGSPHPANSTRPGNKHQRGVSAGDTFLSTSSHVFSPADSHTSQNNGGGDGDDLLMNDGFHESLDFSSRSGKPGTSGNHIAIVGREADPFNKENWDDEFEMDDMDDGDDNTTYGNNSGDGGGGGGVNVHNTQPLPARTIANLAQTAPGGLNLGGGVNAAKAAYQQNIAGRLAQLNTSSPSAAGAQQRHSNPPAATTNHANNNPNTARGIVGKISPPLAGHQEVPGSGDSDFDDIESGFGDTSCETSELRIRHAPPSLDDSLDLVTPKGRINFNTTGNGASGVTTLTALDVDDDDDDDDGGGTAATSGATAGEEDEDWDEEIREEEVREAEAKGFTEEQINQLLQSQHTALSNDYAKRNTLLAAFSDGSHTGGMTSNHANRSPTPTFRGRGTGSISINEREIAAHTGAGGGGGGHRGATSPDNKNRRLEDEFGDATEEKQQHGGAHRNTYAAAVQQGVDRLRDETGIRSNTSTQLKQKKVARASMASGQQIHTTVPHGDALLASDYTLHSNVSLHALISKKEHAQALLTSASLTFNTAATSATGGPGSNAKGNAGGGGKKRGGASSAKNKRFNIIMYPVPSQLHSMKTPDGLSGYNEKHLELWLKSMITKHSSIWKMKNLPLTHAVDDDLIGNMEPLPHLLASTLYRMNHLYRQVVTLESYKQAKMHTYGMGVGGNGAGGLNNSGSPNYFFTPGGSNNPNQPMTVGTLNPSTISTRNSSNSIMGGGPIPSSHTSSTQHSSQQQQQAPASPAQAAWNLLVKLFSILEPGLPNSNLSLNEYTNDPECARWTYAILFIGAKLWHSASVFGEMIKIAQKLFPDYGSMFQLLELETLAHHDPSKANRLMRIFVNMYKRHLQACESGSSIAAEVCAQALISLHFYLGNLSPLTSAPLSEHSSWDGRDDVNGSNEFEWLDHAWLGEKPQLHVTSPGYELEVLTWELCGQPDTRMNLLKDIYPKLTQQFSWIKARAAYVIGHYTCTMGAASASAQAAAAVGGSSAAVPPVSSSNAASSSSPSSASSDHPTRLAEKWIMECLYILDNITPYPTFPWETGQTFAAPGPVSVTAAGATAALAAAAAAAAGGSIAPTIPPRPHSTSATGHSANNNDPHAHVHSHSHAHTAQGRTTGGLTITLNPPSGGGAAGVQHHTNGPSIGGNSLPGSHHPSSAPLPAICSGLPTIPLLSELACNALILYGDILLSLDKYKYAILSYESAILNHEYRRSTEFHSLNRRLVDITIKEDDTDRSILYHIKILQKAQSDGNLNMYVYLVQQLSKLEVSNGSFRKAEEHLREALTFLKPFTTAAGYGSSLTVGGGGGGGNNNPNGSPLVGRQAASSIVMNSADASALQLSLLSTLTPPIQFPPQPGLATHWDLRAESQYNFLQHPPSEFRSAVLNILLQLARLYLDGDRIDNAISVLEMLMNGSEQQRSPSSHGGGGGGSSSFYSSVSSEGLTRSKLNQVYLLLATAYMKKKKYTRADTLLRAMEEMNGVFTSTPGYGGTMSSAGTLGGGQGSFSQHGDTTQTSGGILIKEDRAGGKPEKGSKSQTRGNRLDRGSIGGGPNSAASSPANSLMTPNNMFGNGSASPIGSGPANNSLSPGHPLSLLLDPSLYMEFLVLRSKIALYSRDFRQALHFVTLCFAAINPSSNLGAMARLTLRRGRIWQRIAEECMNGHSSARGTSTPALAEMERVGLVQRVGFARPAGRNIVPAATSSNLLVMSTPTSAAGGANTLGVPSTNGAAAGAGHHAASSFSSSSSSGPIMSSSPGMSSSQTGAQTNAASSAAAAAAQPTCIKYLLMDSGGVSTVLADPSLPVQSLYDSYNYFSLIDDQSHMSIALSGIVDTYLSIIFVPIALKDMPLTSPFMFEWLRLAGFETPPSPATVSSPTSKQQNNTVSTTTYDSFLRTLEELCIEVLENSYTSLWLLPLLQSYAHLMELKYLQGRWRESIAFFMELKAMIVELFVHTHGSPGVGGRNSSVSSGRNSIVAGATAGTAGVGGHQHSQTNMVAAAAIAAASASAQHQHHHGHGGGGGHGNNTATSPVSMVQSLLLNATSSASDPQQPPSTFNAALTKTAPSFIRGLYAILKRMARIIGAYQLASPTSPNSPNGSNGGGTNTQNKRSSTAASTQDDQPTQTPRKLIKERGSLASEVGYDTNASVPIPILLSTRFYQIDATLTSGETQRFAREQLDLIELFQSFISEVYGEEVTMNIDVQSEAASQYGNQGSGHSSSTHDANGHKIKNFDTITEEEEPPKCCTCSIM